jgi:uncharacterized protein (DUF302 family)
MTRPDESGSPLRRSFAQPFDDVRARLPDALKAEGFGVLTTIDVQKTLEQKIGVAFRRYEILGACNPTLAHQALTHSLEIGTMLPCNVVIYQADDGNTVVSAIDPATTVAARDATLAPLAATVRDKLVRVLAAL